MRPAGMFAALAVSLVAFHAQADSSRAWSAARAGLPADARLVVGLDFAAIQKTQLFATYYPKLRDKPEVARVLDTMKDTCKLDPLANVQGVVVAVASDPSDGAVYLGLTGVDRAKLSSCLQAASTGGSGPPALSIKQAGNITQLTEGNQTSYFGWAGKDVIVVSLHADDKASLQKWMGGKGALARSGLGRSIAKLHTSAAMWGASEGERELQPGVTVKGGYGAVTFTNGSFHADVHAVMQSSAQAESMATAAQQQLAKAKQGGQLPPAVASVLGAVTIAASREEIVVKASVVEQDLMSALAILLYGTQGVGGP